MKKLAKWVLGLIVILLLAGWLLLSIFDANQLKKPVLNWLNQHTELDITIGNLEFNPLHPYTLLAEDVQLGTWFKARQLYVAVASLSGQLHLKTLDIIDGELLLDNAAEFALPEPFSTITIDELTTKNFQLYWQDWQVKGAALTLTDWQPRVNQQWQWSSDVKLKGQAQLLSHPELALAQLSFNGQLKQQQLQLERLQSRLFDGLLDTGLTLDIPHKTLSLTAPQFSHNQLQFEQVPTLDADWQLLLDKGQFNEVTVSSPHFSTNNVSGELRYLDWRAGQAPDVRGVWQADEAVLDWLRLDNHQGEWLSSPEQLTLSFTGRAYEGEITSELRWHPQQGRLDIDNLQLLGNKLYWHDDINWPLPELRLHRLNIKDAELLSLDETLPLSILGGDAFAMDIAWSAGVWRPLTEQAQLQVKWNELAFNSLVARHGQASARLNDTQLLLDSFNSEALDGQLELSGQLGLTAPYHSQLSLRGEELALRPLSRWLNGERAFSGNFSLAGALSGALTEPASWQGELNFTGQDIFIEKIALDDWLKRRLQEDYTQEKTVDPTLAALDLASGDGFIYEAQLSGAVVDGHWQLSKSALQSVRHLLAINGEVDFTGGWQLALGIINDQGCRELAINLSQRWRAPTLAIHQPPLKQPCVPWYQGEIAYPEAGLPGSLIEAVHALQPIAE